MVERQLPKLHVVGSNPITRSTIGQAAVWCFRRCGGARLNGNRAESGRRRAAGEVAAEAVRRPLRTATLRERRSKRRPSIEVIWEGKRLRALPETHISPGHLHEIRQTARDAARSFLPLCFALLFACAGGCTPPERQFYWPKPEKHVHEGAGVEHEVGRGETLAGIARLYDVPEDEICKENDVEPGAKLPVGMSLFIPGAKERRQELLVLVKKPGAAAADTKAAEKPIEVYPEGFFICPLNGPAIGEQTTGTQAAGNQGLEIRAVSGCEVVAAKSGSVTQACTVNGWGNVIILDHRGGERTLYALLGAMLVAPGDKVRQGQAIGTLGDSLQDGKPRLHFRIYRGGETIDPRGRFSMK